jgi:hypothetical protein
VMAWMVALVTLYMTQGGLDYDTMNVRSKVIAPAQIDMPKVGDPMYMGRPCLIDDKDPRDGLSRSELNWQNL